MATCFPAFACLKYRTEKGAEDAQPLISPSVPSVDPSSTTSHSKSRNVCARKLSQTRESVC
jgi:hypothetical protein